MVLSHQTSEEIQVIFIPVLGSEGTLVAVADLQYKDTVALHSFPEFLEEFFLRSTEFRAE